MRGVEGVGGKGRREDLKANRLLCVHVFTQKMTL